MGPCARGERERLFGSWEREGKFKITLPFSGRGTGIRKSYGKGNLRLVIPGIPGNPGNHIKSKIKFKIIFMPSAAKAFLISVKMIFATGLHSCKKKF